MIKIIAVILLSIMLSIEIYRKFKEIKAFFTETFKENVYNFLPLFILFIIKTYCNSLSYRFFSNSNFMLITLILWSSLILKTITYHVKILREKQIKLIHEKVTIYVLGLIISCIFLAIELLFEEKNPNQSEQYFVVINSFYFIYTFIQICDLKSKVKEISDIVKDEIPEYTQYIENISKKIDEIDAEIIKKYEEKIEILGDKEYEKILLQIIEKAENGPNKNFKLEELTNISREIKDLSILQHKMKEEINKNIVEKEREIKSLNDTKNFANKQKDRLEKRIQEMKDFLEEIKYTEI
jgi:hypothetical protein